MYRMITSSVNGFWPDQYTWDEMEDDELETAVVDYLDPQEAQVLEELGYTSETAGYGSGSLITFYDNDGNHADVDYDEFLIDEVNMAYESGSPEEYRAQFKDYVLNLNFEH